MRYLPFYSLFFFVIISLKLEAQMSFLPKGPRDISNMIVVDSGNIKVCYAFNKSTSSENSNHLKKKDDTLFNYEICAEDVHFLEIGNRISKYYSYNVFLGDSIFTDYIKKNPNAQAAPHRSGRNPTISNKYFWGEIYKNYTKNILTEYAYMPSNIPNYYYSEDIPNFNWQLQEDTLTVLGYLCQKATCFFRGKNYAVWFTTDVPINDGPWKFGGLPGLIIKVCDDQNTNVFECISITYFKRKFMISTYNYSNYSKTERRKLLKLWEDIFDHYDQIVGIVRISGNYIPKKLPYRPMELE